MGVGEYDATLIALLLLLVQVLQVAPALDEKLDVVKDGVMDVWNALVAGEVVDIYDGVLLAGNMVDHVNAQQGETKLLL
jgi:hypothetical protein